MFQIDVEFCFLSELLNFLLSILLKVSKELEEQSHLQDEFHNNVQPLKHKKNEYFARIQSAKLPPDELRLSNITKLAQDVQQYESQVLCLTDELQTFQNVPPDRLLTQLQYEEELNKLVHVFNMALHHVFPMIQSNSITTLNILLGGIKKRAASVGFRNGSPISLSTSYM
jgi:hypothetical protein